MATLPNCKDEHTVPTPGQDGPGQTPFENITRNTQLILHYAHSLEQIPPKYQQNSQSTDTDTDKVQSTDQVRGLEDAHLNPRTLEVVAIPGKTKAICSRSGPNGKPKLQTQQERSTAS
ncbi:hypothetical protein M758_2G160800 [Ceratodon purpureus]|nr:hypothetical protein M758_2G160800 [Ceratodon purpureus]